MVFVIVVGTPASAAARAPAMSKRSPPNELAAQGRLSLRRM
eukprot:CAMPEP_0179313614 /NCGR_PEP_ID=MMETSP0797-20121207/53927_1 /TAXON_ID=47934 /ORGANISM="Dinophysis acuminata, Strain DAEP01" /LENGTH=40 /DNA_ID= /DNA_START= /DNA_END= /DNA_ORIENTATION=